MSHFDTPPKGLLLVTVIRWQGSCGVGDSGLCIDLLSLVALVVLLSRAAIITKSVPLSKLKTHLV